MNAAIYARVSTKGQKDRGYSLPTQVKGCEDYANRQGFNIVATYQDDVSGATRLDERKGGREMLELVNNGQVQAVIVWRLDRLSRPPEGEYSRLLTTIETLGRAGATVHDCETGEISDKMESIMIAFFKGLAASKERESITERSIRGRMAKAKAGKWVGQGFPPYGFRKVGKGRDAELEIDEVDAAIVRQIYNWYIGRDGPPMSLYLIAQRLTAEGIKTPGNWRRDKSDYWSYSHIGRRILRRRAYLGEFEYKGVKLNFPELAIIDKATWDTAQVRLSEGKSRPRKRLPGNVHLVTGTRLTCTCGGTFTSISCKVNTKNGLNVHQYYRCKKRTQYANMGICNQMPLKVRDVDDAIWQWVVDTISSDERLDSIISEMAEQAAAEIQPAKNELETVEDMADKARNKIKRMMAAFGETDNPTIESALKSQVNEAAALLESLERQRAALKGKIASAEITPAMRAEIKATAQKVRDRLEGGGDDESRLAVIEALDVRAELFYKGNQKWLRVGYGVRGRPDEISIDGPSCA
jgi:site-specific DNA recombinase